MKDWYSEFVTEEEVQEIMNLPHEEFEEYIFEMIDFYRDNPVEAVYDLLGLGLTEYQKIMLVESWNSKNIYWCTSRGAGKSFMMAIFACLKMLLYPDEAILMFGPSYRQSLMLYDKIMTDVYNKSFSFKFEVLEMPRGSMGARIMLRSNSYAKFLPIGDGGSIRGERTTFIFLDEDAQQDKELIDRVIMPMAVSNLNYDPDDPEEGFQPTIVRATSAYFQFNHSYKTFQVHLHRMEFDEDYYCAVIPYAIPLTAKLYNEKFVATQRRDMSNDDFDMEMDCKWITGNENAFIGAQAWDKGIKYDDTLEPLFCGEGNKEYVLFADIARSEGGDNASLKLCEIRGERLAVVREKALNGQAYQVIRDEIRKFLVGFNVIDLWMDKLGGGEAVADLLAEDWLDYETGEKYPPILTVDSPRSDGTKLLTFIVADNALNHRMGHMAKKHIEKGRFIFPTLFDKHPEKEVEMAYLDLIMVKKEVTNIQAIPAGNFQKFIPTKGSKLRKDRWTTFCYASLYIEEKLIKHEDDELIIEVF
jgi:hypothetical protein